MTGILSCPDPGRCCGGTPARFRADFSGSGFSTVDIGFQGTLTSLGLPPDDRGTFYGTVHTVLITGTPTYVGNQLQEIGSHQILSLTTSFGLDAPTGGKVTNVSHEPADTIPAGAFYGYPVLKVEYLTGQVDFRDPLTNHFSSDSAVPEPGTFGAVAIGLLAILLVRNRLPWAERGPWPRGAVKIQPGVRLRGPTTALVGREWEPRVLYEELYGMRGEMENRIQEPSALIADWAGTETMRAPKRTGNEVDGLT